MTVRFLASRAWPRNGSPRHAEMTTDAIVAAVVLVVIVVVVVVAVVVVVVVVIVVVDFDGVSACPELPCQCVPRDKYT